MKTIIKYKGKNYHRYPEAKQLSRRNYYYNGEFLHRQIYKDNFGEIPKGFHIHHKDHDVFNNKPNNLQVISNSEHGKLHWREKEPVEKNCIQCNNIFNDMNNRESNRYCSNKCKSKFRRDSGVDNEDRFCKKCQKTFSTNKYGKIVFCSYLCSNNSDCSRYTRPKPQMNSAV